AAVGATGVGRMLVISPARVPTAPARTHPNPPKHDPGDGFFMQHLFSPIAKAAFRKVYADLAQMEGIVTESGMDWTVVRPPQLTDKPLTRAYRTAYGQNIRGGWAVPRADVAHLMLGLVNQPEPIHQIIG